MPTPRCCRAASTCSRARPCRRCGCPRTSRCGPPRRALMLLTLRRCAPPPAGWPTWLEDGLAGVAEATAANGAGPSPLKMLAARQQAGPEAIVRVLRGDRRDAALATAICAPLAHSKRRHLLPNLLDGLRNGMDGIAAIKLAYGLTPERLAIDK